MKKATSRNSTRSSSRPARSSSTRAASKAKPQRGAGARALAPVKNTRAKTKAKSLPRYALGGPFTFGFGPTSQGQLEGLSAGAKKSRDQMAALRAYTSSLGLGRVGAAIASGRYGSGGFDAGSFLDALYGPGRRGR